jgi:hypothetical protein
MLSKNGDYGYKVDVEDMQMSKEIQYRSLSPELAEGWRGRRRVRPMW